MGILNPLALALFALAAPIVALYFLKLRREERTVSSTYLWRTLVRDTAANAPWQRLRPNLLLLLQLLFLLALILALLRPYAWGSAAAGDHLILVLDTSASMGATDETPDRLGAAVRQARRLVEGLPAGARVTVITAGDGASAPVSGSTDRREVYTALDGIRAGASGSDLSAALGLASAIAARERDPETVILSDGNVTLPAAAPGAGALSIPGRVRYIPVGRSAVAGSAPAGNLGIMALSLRKSAGGQGLSAFVQVTNFGAEPVERRLALLSGGQPIAARTLSLTPGQPQALTFEDLPPDTGVVEARLEGSDALAIDDRAWAAPAGGAPLQVDLVGPGNRFLETALALLPGIEVTAIEPGEYEAAARTDGAARLTIFDGVAAPESLPPGSLLFVAPVSSTPLFSITGTIQRPIAEAARVEEPLLRYVELKDLQIQEAAAVPLPAWARPVITAQTDAGCGAGTGAQSAGRCPLLFAGESAGRRIVVVAFDVRKSDLPLRVAFPLLLANLLDYLNARAGAGSLPEAVQPGDSVMLAAPAGARAVAVTLPDGTIRQIATEAGRASFAETGQPGAYQVSWSGDGSSGGELGTFAVNLFKPLESSIAPKNTLAVRGSADAAAQEGTRQGRHEWWRPLAWAALALLAAEWLYAQRSAVARLYEQLRVVGR